MIEALGLPTRPTKKSDTRARHFKGDSVEVDAIEPAMLRKICVHVITQHIDPRALRATTAIEAAEAETLDRIAWDLDDAIGDQR